MPAELLLDQHTLATVKTRGNSIMEYTRGAIVSGLSSTKTVSAINEALNHPDLPAIWSADPEDTRFRLVDIEPTPLSPHDMQLILRYAYVGAVLVETNVYLESRPTSVDVNGNKITVTCTGTVDRPVDPRDQTQTAVVTGHFPTGVFSLAWIEASKEISGGVHPVVWQRALIRKVNSTPWEFEGGIATAQPYPARTCRCSGVNILYEGYGKFCYRIIATFAYRPETWDAVAEFIDPETGAPHVGNVAGQGTKVVPLLEAEDFNSLIGPVPK